MSYSFALSNNTKSIIHNSFLNATETKEADLDGRKIIQLPALENYVAKWNELGITWLQNIDHHPLSAKALLPLGWQFKNKAAFGDCETEIVLDKKLRARAIISKKTAFYDEYANVNFLSKEEGLAYYKAEIAEKEAKRMEALASQDLLSLKSDEWSTQFPYAILFKKNMIPFIKRKGWDFCQESTRKICCGFFASSELAEKAEQLLKKNSVSNGSYDEWEGDCIYYNKMDAKELELIKWVCQKNCVNKLEG